LDSSYSGYYYSRGKDRLSKVCVDGNVENGINAFLNRYFITTSDSKEGSIYIQLKKFWLRNKEAFALKRGIPEYSIHLKMEFYLKKEDCYYPLYRIDSMYFLKGKSDETASVLIRKALIETTAKLSRRELTTRTLRCIPIEVFRY
jgi:hypothetical protein